MQTINKMNNLKFLQLSYSTVHNEFDISLSLLEELYIDNTNVNNLSFLLKLHNLHKLSISDDQFEKNKEVINELLKKDVKVYNENIIQYERDDIYE